jgi:hypothetical protein
MAEELKFRHPGQPGPCRAASAIVGHAELKLGDRVEPVLEALQAASPNRFGGIRHTVTWDPHPEIENREKEGVLTTADYRAGAQVGILLRYKRGSPPERPGRLHSRRGSAKEFMAATPARPN